MISLPTELTESSDEDLLLRSMGAPSFLTKRASRWSPLLGGGVAVPSDCLSLLSVLLFNAAAAAMAAAEALNLSSKALCSAKTSDGSEAGLPLFEVGKKGYAFRAAAKKWLEAKSGLNKACLWMGKAERPGRLKVGGKKGKALENGEYRDGAKGKGLVAAVVEGRLVGEVFRTSGSFALTGELEIPFCNPKKLKAPILEAGEGDGGGLDDL